MTKLDNGPLVNATAAESIDRAVARRRHDPGRGICGHPIGWPAAQGDRERVLDGVLGMIEVARRPRDDRNRPAPLRPEYRFDYEAPPDG